MALHEITLPKNAVDAAVNRSSSQIAVLHEDSISIVRYSPKIKESSIPSVEHNVSIPTSKSLKALQICYEDETSILILMVNLQDNSQSIYRLATKQSFALMSTPSANVGLFPADQDGLTCLSSDNVVSKVILDTHTEDAPEHAFAELETVCTFPGSAPWVDVVHVADEVCL